MNRRGFLGLLGAAIAGIAVDQAIPLGRVWSFPKNIVIPPKPIALDLKQVHLEIVREFGVDMAYDPTTSITVVTRYHVEKGTKKISVEYFYRSRDGSFSELGPPQQLTIMPVVPRWDRLEPFIPAAPPDSHPSPS
jgi:hypothetical protein